MRAVFLSHFLDARTPLYGGAEGIGIEAVKSMAAGDASNALRFAFPGHAGTHVDLPLHFVREGQALESFPAGHWIFERTGLLDLPSLLGAPTTAPGQRLGGEILDLAPLPEDMDLLLVRTGLGARRGEAAYWSEGPVFEPSLAGELRSRFPRLRALGMDTISLSSWMDRTRGREAHRAFLEGSHPILLIEDMDLAALPAGARIHRIVAAPLQVRGADGVPCTVLAEVAP